MTLEVIEEVSQQIQRGLYHGASFALFRSGSWQEHYIGTLDSPLRHYYPDAQKLEVTLRQLLTHTSGLDPYIPNRDQLNAQQLRQAMHQLQGQGG